MKKKRNFWLVLSSIITAVVIIFVGTFLLTKLSNVSVEFTTRLSAAETRLETGILDKVRESGEFDFKKSVLITNTNESLSKIEKANPYVKVEKIVRKFPNKIKVYISERIPKYRIKESSTSTNWFILDKDFKVLEYVDSEELTTKNLDSKTVEVKCIMQKTYVGDFLDRESDKNNLNQIMTGVYSITENYFVVKNIDFDEEGNYFDLTMSDGCVLRLVGTSNLTSFARKATYVYTGSDSEIPVSGHDLSQTIIFIDSETHCILQNKD